MNRLCFGEPDVAVNARARIPARKTWWIVQPDGEQVFAAEIHERGQIQPPRRIAVRPAADKYSIAPDRCVGHRSIHI